MVTFRLSCIPSVISLVISSVRIPDEEADGDKYQVQSGPLISLVVIWEASVADYALIAGVENYIAGVLPAVQNAKNDAEAEPALSRKRTHLETWRSSVFPKCQVRLVNETPNVQTHECLRRSPALWFMNP